jgi:hypothetical protein
VDPQGYLFELSGPLPSRISELELYPSLPSLRAVHPRALAYRPKYELWSNGTEKERFLVLPEGTEIASEQPEHFQFPVGTLLLKTFSAPRVSSSGELLGERPLETRTLRLGPAGWEYGVYLWDEAAAEAEFVDISQTRRVAVEIDGERFEHVVPAKLDCRKCHESHPATVLGFNELQLNAPHSNGANTQLEQLHDAAIVTHLPAAPEAISATDSLTAEVLGYLHGNCTHCHNGSGGPSSSFDLRHEVALEHLIGRPTEGEATAGIRVVPGAPEGSALYLAVTREAAMADVQPMPPVGVERVDSRGVELFRSWIAGLAEAPQ